LLTPKKRNPIVQLISKMKKVTAFSFLAFCALQLVVGGESKSPNPNAATSLNHKNGADVVAKKYGGAFNFF